MEQQYFIANPFGVFMAVYNGALKTQSLEDDGCQFFDSLEELYQYTLEQAQGQLSADEVEQFELVVVDTTKSLGVNRISCSSLHLI